MKLDKIRAALEELRGAIDCNMIGTKDAIHDAALAELDAVETLYFALVISQDAEREACAVIAENVGQPDGNRIARRIRARNKEEHDGN